MKRYLNRRRAIMGAAVMVSVCFIAMLAIAFGALVVEHPSFLLGALAIVPLVAIVDTSEDFEKKVLNGVDELRRGQVEQKSRVDKVLEDLDRSDKEVKKQMEEVTKVKNQVNTSYEQVMREISKLQRAIVLNARSSFRDPVERAVANEEVRAYLNAVARVIGLESGARERTPGEMRKLVEEGTASIKSLTGVDSSLGQATIPTQTFNEIYDTLLEYGDWPSLGVVRVGMRTTVLPVGTARPQFYWIGSGTGGAGETTAITEGAFTGSSVNLIIQTLAVYLTVARELLADSTVDLASYILRQMAQSISYGMDTAAFSAAGAASQTDAGYVGIFQAAQANTKLAAAATAGNTTVDALQLEDFVRCLTTVSPIVLRRQAKWWMHPVTLAKVVLIRDKNGRPIFQTWQEVPNPGSIGSILGYPVKPVSAAPSTDAAAQPVVVYGDPDGQAVGIRSDMELATSDDIKFAENMRAFRALMRAGTKLKTAAASDTLKPFAVLTLAAQ